MNPTLRATETTSVPSDARVRHIDELHDDAQTALSAAADGASANLPSDAAGDLADGDVVRFTGYYRVHIAR